MLHCELQVSVVSISRIDKTLHVLYVRLSYCPDFRFLDAILNFLLVWYYCTLTIRESILITNGSRSYFLTSNHLTKILTKESISRAYERQLVIS